MKYVTLHVLIPAWAPSATGKPLLMLDDLKYSNDYCYLSGLKCYMLYCYLSGYMLCYPW